jgi:hypothetical protein
MMTFIKTILFIWPFLKEMVLGNKSLAEAVKTNKLRVLFMALIVLSIGMNFFTVTRLVGLSLDYVTLKREHEKAIGVIRPKKPVEAVPVPVEPAIVPAAADEATDDSDERWKRTQEFFETMNTKHKKS